MYEFKTKPYEHQKTALKAARDKEGFAFLMEMGTGKTKVAIDEMGILFSEGKIKTVLILAPKGVYMNWILKEFPVHLSVDADIIHWLAGGGNKTHQSALRSICTPSNKLRIVVMNIEALSSGTKALQFARHFMNSGECYAAVDESTFIKNAQSNRTKRVCELGLVAKYRRIMTGSPVTRSPLDLFSQFEFLKPAILGHRSFFSFRGRYAVMQQKEFGGRNVQVVVGYRNTEDLTARIKDHSYRVRKEECLDLPPKTYTIREVPMTEEQLRVYKDVKDTAFSEIGDSFVTASSAITILLRLHQVVCGHVTNEDGDVITLKSNRVDAMMDVISEVSGDVIIWAAYKHDIRSITAALRAEYGDESVAEFHGGNTNTRQNDAARFTDEDSCRFMVSNQQSGGYGNTWINANTTIYFSNNYDLEKRLQSEDRNHRSGQEDKVLYVDLVSPNTVDERILKALRKKINIADTIMDEGVREWIV